jgi:hypothetical protein
VCITDSETKEKEKEKEENWEFNKKHRIKKDETRG